MLLIEFFKILVYIFILIIFIGMIYGIWLVSDYIKRGINLFGTQNVEKGDTCQTHNDCKGWKPAKIGTNGCCTAAGKSAGLGVEGKCIPLVGDSLGLLGYCPKEVPL